MSCRICGHVFSEKHRLVPGHRGGQYEYGNVVDLCPNHHAAIHFLMQWLGADKTDDQIDAMGTFNAKRLNAYLADKSLFSFWCRSISPLCDQMNKSERSAIREFIRSRQQ